MQEKTGKKSSPGFGEISEIIINFLFYLHILQKIWYDAVEEEKNKSHVL